MGGNTINSVFYADTYHPIQAGSIDGTDILPHDNAVYRAHLCSSAGLYNPFGDPKVTGDPYCTLFVGRLSHLTNEDSLRKAMSKYGRVKNLRLVRHIVTGASCGYAFVEYETEREMRRAYEDAHHSIIDDFEIIVDYNRQQLMQGWIPRRLGGGLGGKKESGQLRFGGRERPFRAPLRPIPFDDLNKLGIPPPPEGRYMSRFQVPSPPRRKRSSMDREARSHMSSVNREEYSLKERSVDRVERSHRKRSVDREEESRDMASIGRGAYSRRSSVDVDREERYHKRGYRDREEQSRERNSISRGEHSHRRSSVDREESYHKRGSRDREAQSRERNSIRRGEHSHRSSVDREESSHKRSSTDREERSHKRSFTDRKELSQERSSIDRSEHSLKRSSADKEESSHKRNSMDRDARSHKRQKHSSNSHRPERRQSSWDHF